MAQLTWVIMLLQCIMQLRSCIKHNVLMLPNILMFTKSAKKRRKSMQVPLLIFSTLEYLIKDKSCSILVFWRFCILHHKGLLAIELHFKPLVEKACPSFVWPNCDFSTWQLIHEVFPNMVIKSMEQYVLLAFIETIAIITTFDLWMFWRGFDIFMLVVNYINPCFT
jgi:hypothetical protein